ncbi:MULTISPECIES: hypothetical protein [unclassified Chryseobacterium]|nr:MULTISPECIES: hypothetical protein [unclassified Chryseobacterium]
METIMFTTARKVHDQFLTKLGAGYVIDCENEEYITVIGIEIKK